MFHARPLMANYAAAQQAFVRRDYVRAASGFFQSYSNFRDAGERAKAEWGLAESLKGANLLYSASKFYSIIVKRGPSRNNPFFRQAMEELGKINSTLSLGQSHIVQLFTNKIDTSYVPGPARGFYFYYLGVEAFIKQRFEKAAEYFQRVPSGSPYGIGAQFYLGVISNLSGKHSRGVDYFERVISALGRSEDRAEMREQALMNIGRILYETRRYRESIRFYRQIPRDSDNWLDALWEASWAFFIMQNHNESLGNIHTIHSPFFINRFYPESYILQAINFLRLCRYNQVKESIKSFHERYGSVYRDIQSMLDRHQGDSKAFFKLVYNYRTGALDSYQSAWSILDTLSRTDVYKEAGDTIRFSDQELARLSRMSGSWRASGLQDELESFLQSKKNVALADAGKRLYEMGRTFYTYLRDLDDQASLIQAEMLEGKLELLRRKINVGNTSSKKVEFIGGMQELNVAQRYEYWPFETEYWEDELGYYVYNIDSKCSSGKKGK